jgi:hypothetical protein
MRVSMNYTVRCGPDAQFDTVAADLRKCFPNLCRILEGVERPDALATEWRWRHHVLHQLTFSYLKQDYLARTVSEVLRQLPADKDAAVFGGLRSTVAPLANGAKPLTPESVAVLNNIAIDLADWCDNNKLAIIEAAMNGIGRWAFSDAKPANKRRVDRYFAYLLLGLENHVGSDVFCRRMREYLSIAEYDDCRTLKNACIEALKTYRDDLLRISNAHCIFICPDIKMYAESMSLGEVRVLRWNSPDLQSFLTQPVRQHMEKRAMAAPHTAYMTLVVPCHPDGIAEALVKASSLVQQKTGFLVSQSSGAYCPPLRYAAFGFLPGTDGFQRSDPTGTPRYSDLAITADLALDFQELHRNYIEPALREPVERSLRERLRRMLRGLRRASFAAGCGEWSQAYSCAWQAYELVFAGSEGRDRGALISRRVAALAIGPDSLGIDDSFDITDEDLYTFCAAWKRREIEGFRPGEEAQAVMSRLAERAGADRGLLKALAMSLGSDETDVLLRWKMNQVTEAARGKTAAQVRLEVHRRRSEVMARLEQCYKLRNDIVHAGYDYEFVAEDMFKEMTSLFRAFVINIAFNCAAKVTYPALLEALDEEWEGAERQIREKAYLYWLGRGQPIGDDWADWFRAVRETRGAG